MAIRNFNKKDIFRTTYAKNIIIPTQSFIERINFLFIKHDKVFPRSLFHKILGKLFFIVCSRRNIRHGYRTNTDHQRLHDRKSFFHKKFSSLFLVSILTYF